MRRTKPRRALVYVCLACSGAHSFRCLWGRLVEKSLQLHRLDLITFDPERLRCCDFGPEASKAMCNLHQQSKTWNSCSHCLQAQSLQPSLLRRIAPFQPMPYAGFFSQAWLIPDGTSYCSCLYERHWLITDGISLSWSRGLPASL